MRFEENLAPYAVREENSRGRHFQENPSSTRTEYQRDRDRIIHCTGFRRLEYKTQVFVNHEGDLFRTRLTHSLEVAQIAKSIARNMRLNEDLVEAIALAHDLGHTPFGHAGQDALNDCMKDFGGFEHNLQSLRVVDKLEERYGAFDGLNLTFETREGILKHCAMKNAVMMGDVGERFINKKQPSLEAQLTNLADAIAYNNHDIDDGVRSGLITTEQLSQVSIYSRHAREVSLVYPGISSRRAVAETIRRIINTLITDLITTSQIAIDAEKIETLDDVRNTGKLILFSPDTHAEAVELKKFLRENLYNHYIVNRMTTKARKIVTDLFNAFIAEPTLLSPDYYAKDGTKSEQARLIADYIAGMTDRYAIRIHQEIFSVE
jgi:dGTPase